MEGTSGDSFMEEVRILMFCVFLIDYICVCFNICLNVHCLKMTQTDSAIVSHVDASMPILPLMLQLQQLVHLEYYT